MNLTLLSLMFLSCHLSKRLLKFLSCSCVVAKRVGPFPVIGRSSNILCTPGSPICVAIFECEWDSTGWINHWCDCSINFKVQFPFHTALSFKHISQLLYHLIQGKILNGNLLSVFLVYSYQIHLLRSTRSNQRCVIAFHNNKFNIVLPAVLWVTHVTLHVPKTGKVDLLYIFKVRSVSVMSVPGGEHIFLI